jgi:quinol monooxygenase YgiN
MPAFEHACTVIAAASWQVSDLLPAGLRYLGLVGSRRRRRRSLPIRMCINARQSSPSELIHTLMKSLLVFLISTLPLVAVAKAAVEPPEKMIRLAKLQIHPEHLEAYKAALKEEIEASIRLEPGVLALRAVSEKQHPTRITIMEIYASVEAYNAHIASPHFQKYKVGTEHMVKALELVEVDPILLGEKAR